METPFTQRLGLIQSRVAGRGYMNRYEIIRFGSQSIGSLSGRSEDVMETLKKQRTDICCLQGVGQECLERVTKDMNSSGRVVDLARWVWEYWFWQSG